ncbi:hypothetical protein F5884DRAFT_791046 [Xylogone sp. PMI_703]|nr:hypothetical protein F5884DRAFT_791046 [Xylogone sp. PMI_703]
MVAELFNHPGTMDTIQGVDVSWMTRNPSVHQKDHPPQQRPVHEPSYPVSTEHPPANGNTNGHPADAPSASAKPIPIRQGIIRSNSSEVKSGLNGSSKPGSVSPRRNSWLSSISSKFSSSPGAQQTSSPPTAAPVNGHNTADTSSPRPTGSTPPKNGPTQPGAKVGTDTPPPKSGQPNFIQSALRRLSSSGGPLSSGYKNAQHGPCERRILNVDTHRERCSISELDQSKLRRVAFCVDVEIASSPRYSDDGIEEKKKEKKEKKIIDKGEGDALKNPTAVQNDAKVDKATNDTTTTPSETTSNEAPKEPSETIVEVKQDANGDGKDISKKKEKKKRSEEERKARKEKKRKLAEANGTLPVELVRQDSDDSSLDTPRSGTPKVQATPTIDPVRIYRRCCQLRETPILKKVTEQLAAAASSSIAQPGVVQMLDLSGYWLQLQDLVTLGDYLAVVPVKELILENCGLTDEGIRVVLAGLLAAKSPDFNARRRIKGGKDGQVPQGGFVERVVFKNNTKIGVDGWRYISLFINMCRTLKSIDLSQVPFPQAPPPTNVAASTSHLHLPHPHHVKPPTATPTGNEIYHILSKAIGERLADQDMELINLADTGITTEQLGVVIDGVIKCGLRRLGLADNNLTAEGVNHVARYLKQGKCEGLDLGGNDLKDLLGVVAEALEENNLLVALSLAGCNLTPDSLWSLFPALAKLQHFRFIDLSQNRELFSSNPSALSLFRRYLPKMPILRRIHLADVSMTPEQAIALAEILPESPTLAHISLMENPQLAMLANAKTEADQEEAAALYASLMAAVRVSRTIVCIDIEVPSPESSEVVKALAKQVVAYCLWNMERDPLAEITESVTDTAGMPTSGKDVQVPDVLLHLVGHVEGVASNHDDDDPAPDDDYVIGGTGVVKALGICLSNRGNDSPSRDGFRSGTATPISRVSSGKAKDMSKNLLGSARKIRARLQPALVKESRSGDRNNYNRLLFLDRTLEKMIKRFEDEFPETRLAPPDDLMLAAHKLTERIDGSDDQRTTTSLENEQAIVDGGSDEEGAIYPTLSRHNSDVSLASRALSQEEGRMHRFGQAFRRDILKPEMEDHAHGTTGTEIQPAHLQMLRSMVDDLGGEDIKRRIEAEGQDVLLEELRDEASLLREQIKAGDPEAWDRFIEAQNAAQRNSAILSIPNESAIV